jgi:hypothetical protein
VQENIAVTNARRYSQRQPNSQAGDQAYQDSGAALQPFHDDQLQQRQTSQINHNTQSPEDFPWRSIQLGQGERRYLMPGAYNAQPRTLRFPIPLRKLITNIT